MPTSEKTWPVFVVPTLPIGPALRECDECLDFSATLSRPVLLPDLTLLLAVLTVDWHKES